MMSQHRETPLPVARDELTRPSRMNHFQHVVLSLNDVLARHFSIGFAQDTSSAT